MLPLPCCIPDPHILRGGREAAQFDDQPNKGAANLAQPHNIKLTLDLGAGSLRCGEAIQESVPTVYRG
jgi:hypothetical protein